MLEDRHCFYHPLLLLLPSPSLILTLPPPLRYSLIVTLADDVWCQPLAFVLLDRASIAAAAVTVSAGGGFCSTLFFWDLRRTCWEKILSMALTFEYTFALIAVGIESQDWPHMQQTNVRSPRTRHLVDSFLFKDMLKTLHPIERTWAAQIMSPWERELIAVNHHYTPCVSRLWRKDPCWSEPENNA